MRAADPVIAKPGAETDADTSIGAKAFSAVGADVTVVVDGRGATVNSKGALSDESAPAIPGSEDANPGNLTTAL